MYLCKELFQPVQWVVVFGMILCAFLPLCTESHILCQRLKLLLYIIFVLICCFYGLSILVLCYIVHMFQFFIVSACPFDFDGVVL